MQEACGIEAAMDLYESSIVPSLLANCATWVDIEKKIEDKLNKIYDLFWPHSRFNFRKNVKNKKVTKVS